MKRVFALVVVLMFIVVGISLAQVKAPAQPTPAKPSIMQPMKPPVPVAQPAAIDINKATADQLATYKTANDAWLAQQQKRVKNLQITIETLQKQLPVVQKQVTDAQAVSAAIANKK